MITVTLKNRVDALWDIFYSGGFSSLHKQPEKKTAFSK